jgi:hypothetical protein
MTAAEVLRKHPDKYSGYAKVSCFRHPYNRLVSHYFRRFEYGKYKGSIKKWVREIPPTTSTFYHVSIDGQVDIDHWILFEDLEKTLVDTLDSLGIKPPNKIPHLKKSAFSGDYREYLDSDDVDVIHTRFKNEIKLAKQLGYRLDA